MKTENQLIANFVGCDESIDFNRWDWLMDAVDKIEVVLTKRETTTRVGWEQWAEIFNGTINTDKMVAHEIVVEFIKWYNEKA